MSAVGPIAARAGGMTFFSVVLMGCVGKQTQLEHVARDWCLTISASQVIPVYPLSADLQPGDVFLVSVPVDKQRNLYKKRGFLALDHHIARLDPDSYADFYARSYFEQDRPAILPRDWIKPGPVDAGATGGTTGNPPQPRTSAAWERAPIASFPQYSFSVRRGAGLSLAVPISGVPVGMSLMGSDAADGSISISEARTMGVDIISLYRQLQSWAERNADFLINFAPDAARAHEKNYLRVVYRVFATGKMDVFLADQSSTSAGLDAGVPKPVKLLAATPAAKPADGASPTSPKDNTMDDYKDNLSKLNEVVQAAVKLTEGATKTLPGGSVRVNAAGGRTISLSQEFDPPIILGYLGFDVAVGPNGRLGRPIPTYAVIDKDVPESSLDADAVIETLYGSGLPRKVYDHLKESTPASQRGLSGIDELDAVARQFLPASVVVYRPGQDGDPRVVGNLQERTETYPERNEAPYLALKTYLANLGSSAVLLDRELAKPELHVKRLDGSVAAIKAGDPLHVELSAFSARCKADANNRAMLDAVRAASTKAAKYYIGMLSADDR
jgi:hypothetical protein